MLGREHRDEIFIAERGWMAVCLDMVVVLRGTFTIHVVRIPRRVGATGGNGINPPVGVDTELIVLEPLWCGVLPQGMPAWMNVLSIMSPH